MMLLCICSVQCLSTLYSLILRTSSSCTSVFTLALSAAYVLWCAFFLTGTSDGQYNVDASMKPLVNALISLMRWRGRGKTREGEREYKRG